MAGTGELDGQGVVGAIGGIQQKIAGAREAGAELFLVPEANCPDALGADDGDMRLVRATTFVDDAGGRRGLGRGPGRRPAQLRGRSVETADDRPRPMTRWAPSTPTPPSRRPCSRSSRTSRRAGGTSRPGSTRWCRPPTSYAASRSWPRRWAWTRRRPRGRSRPVEQDQLPPDRLLEDALTAITWPPQVAGCAAVVERLVLPPDVDGEVPDDVESAERFAREHPDRQEVRIVAGVTRAGSAYAALRLRAHDDASSVVGGTDLVPGLTTLLGSTLDNDPMTATRGRHVSELFDEDPRDTVQERPPGRSRALVITAVVLIIAFFGLTTFSNFYTERLWFRDADYGSVFSTLLWTRVGLFLVFGTIMASVVAANIVIAFRLRPLFHPPSPEQTGLDRYRQAVTPIRTWLVIGIAALLGLFAGTSGAGEWRTYLLWRNSVPFGQKDAYFDRDISFFVFELPWLPLHGRRRHGRRHRVAAGGRGRALPLRRHPAADAR